jgi:prolyl 4-hydroxylase
MVVKLNDFIHVYDDVLSKETCDFLIEVFENNSDKHERIEKNKTPNFTQFNLTENSKLSDKIEEIHNLIISKVLYYKKLYYDFVDDRCFPRENTYEQFRIKKYNNDGYDEFDSHVDVVSYSTSRRFLSFFWYLNDVEKGGETVFHEKVIKPKIGRLVIFPPFWIFPHKGNAPISNKKYLLSTYLHYK